MLLVVVAGSNYSGSNRATRKLVNSSPPVRQSPNTRRNQFDQISCWITEIQRFAAPRPFVFLLDCHTAFLQFLPPSVQCVSLDAKSKMPWSFGSVGRPLIALERGI